MFKTKVLFFIILLNIVFSSCNQKKVKEEFKVTVRLGHNIESLNPLNSNNFHAEKVVSLLYQALLTIDYSDNKIKPLLAENLPEVVQKDSLTYITYHIRKEANWDSAVPITASDVAFTLKMIKAPLINNERKKLVLEFIQDIILDSANPKKFTLICNDYIPEKLFNSGDFNILPKLLVDPEGNLDDFSLKELHSNPDRYASDEKIIKAAAFFNSDKFTRQSDLLNGSGPYTIQQWQSGQYVQVKRKDNWWGDDIKFPWFAANPATILFKIIPDNASALIALKNREIDVYDEVPVGHFELLKEDKTLQDQFNFFTATSYYFHYIGINSRNPKVADPFTRKALSNLLEIEQIVKIVYKGNAIPTAGLIHPDNKSYYNDTLGTPSLNIHKCRNLLKQAGWNWDGNSWIKGKQKLELTLQYKAGNNDYENIGLIFKQAASQAGIIINLQPVEAFLLKQNLKNHQFDLYLSYLAGTPLSFNYKPILHTSAAENGSNYTGFGSNLSDSLMHLINLESSENKKALLLKKLQAEFFNQGSIIPLFFSNNLIIINKNYEIGEASSIKPGYDLKTIQKKLK